MSFVVSLSFSLSQHVRSSSQLLGMNNMLSSSGTNWMMVNLMGDQSFYHVLYHCTLYTLEFLLLPTSSFLSVFWMKFRFGTCCVFTVSASGSTITQNCTYIRNPGYPNNYGETTAASYTIQKCSCSKFLEIRD